MSADIEYLVRLWESSKLAEADAMQKRRRFEDLIVEALEIPESLDGTENFDVGNYKLKIVGRLNRKIDAEKLAEIAKENGLSDHLQSLFRWKAEMNVTAWKSAAEAITRPLLGAVTTEPGRPSFSIQIKEQ
jgi:hypothetical protein